MHTQIFSKLAHATKIFYEQNTEFEVPIKVLLIFRDNLGHFTGRRRKKSISGTFITSTWVPLVVTIASLPRK